ncbi:hypothetical protein [Clostridium sp.]|uniref:hypothetical protein n=1 Tax=Clostridium sp. TaxID=1506 RepID=UPI002FC95223
MHSNNDHSYESLISGFAYTTLGRLLHVYEYALKLDIFLLNILNYIEILPKFSGTFSLT